MTFAAGLNLFAGGWALAVACTLRAAPLRWRVVMALLGLLNLALALR
jgi:hypothetical protein